MSGPFFLFCEPGLLVSIDAIPGAFFAKFDTPEGDQFSLHFNAIGDLSALDFMLEVDGETLLQNAVEKCREVDELKTIANCLTLIDEGDLHFPEASHRDLRLARAELEDAYREHLQSGGDSRDFLAALEDAFSCRGLVLDEGIPMGYRDTKMASIFKERVLDPLYAKLESLSVQGLPDPADKQWEWALTMERSFQVGGTEDRSDRRFVILEENDGDLSILISEVGSSGDLRSDFNEVFPEDISRVLGETAARAMRHALISRGYCDALSVDEKTMEMEPFA